MTSIRCEKCQEPATASLNGWWLCQAHALVGAAWIEATPWFELALGSYLDGQAFGGHHSLVEVSRRPEGDGDLSAFAVDSLKLVMDAQGLATEHLLDQIMVHPGRAD